MARVELPSKEETPSNYKKDKIQNKPVASSPPTDYKPRKKEKTFVEEGAKEVKNYVIDSVVMPTIKDMIFNVFSGIFDIFKDAIEAKIFGIDEVGRNRSRSRSRSRRMDDEYIGYSSIRDDDRRRGSRRGRGERARARDVMDYEDIWFDDMYQANTALRKAMDVFEDRGCMLKVSDFKKILKYDEDDITYIDQEWGWYSLSTAIVKPLRNGGYKIDMPRPRPLD